MSEQNYNINQGQGNKFKIAYSNFPNTNLKDVSSLYENFTKKVMIPEYGFDTKESRYKGTAILQPVSQMNTDLPELVLTYKLDSKFLNYYNIHQFIQRMRYNVDITTEFVFQNTIRTLDIIYLDNVNRTQKIVRFSECLAVYISSLDLEFGEHDAPEFDVTFKYREVTILEQTELS